MSQAWSSNSSNGSRSEPENGRARAPPFVRRPDDAIAAALSGRPSLTTANLARNNTILANDLRKYNAPEKACSIASAATSFGLDLPPKTKAQLLERYCEVGPMDRFKYGTEGGVGGPVDARFWEQLVAQDPLAAEIDREVRAGQRK